MASGFCWFDCDGTTRLMDVSSTNPSPSSGMCFVVAAELLVGMSRSMNKC